MRRASRCWGPAKRPELEAELATGDSSPRACAFHELFGVFVMQKMYCRKSAKFSRRDISGKELGKIQLFQVLGRSVAVTAPSASANLRDEFCEGKNVSYAGRMPKILLAWLGGTDINCGKKDDPADPGPTARVLGEREFDALVLLGDSGSAYSTEDILGYVDWLKTRDVPPVHLRDEILDNPTDYTLIFDAVVRALDFVASEFGDDADLAFHVNPGTPAMQAMWLMLGKTKAPAELIQSSKEAGVETVSFPFDLSVEYVPDLLRRPDAKLRRLSQGLEPDAPEFKGIIRRSPVMERAIARARKVAPRGSDVPVLIEGDPGTGKELFARAIHDTSPREKKPFVAVNCGAITQTLIESELFGHVKGAFTDSKEARKGHFESAHGGTLFLDEVGELPLEAQVKLLRVLQEKEVTPVGASASKPVDVRIIAATNRDLMQEVMDGRFREDLYHRLAVALIQLPPLRERQGDLGLLIEELLDRINRETTDQPGYEHKKLSPAAKNLMLKHSWPGNVRELQNTLLRLSIWSAGPTITVEDVRDELLKPRPGRSADLLGLPLGAELQLPKLMKELSSHYLDRALEEAEGNKTKAAALIGLPSYQTFTNWMKTKGVRELKKAKAR